MIGKQIGTLLEKCDTLSKFQLSNELGISERTLDTWLDDNKQGNKQLDQLYVEKIQKIYENDLLQGPLKDISDIIFNVQPCELVSIWIMKRISKELILIRDTSRHENIQDKNYSRRTTYYNDEIHKDLNEKSITMYAVHHGGIVNLAGSFILEHPWKKTPNLSCGYLSSGESRSLLKLGFKIPDRFEQATRVVLSLENALYEIENTNVPFKLIEPKKNEKSIFEEKKIRKIEQLFHTLYIEQLQPLLIQLDYQDREYTTSDFLPLFDTYNN